MSLSRRDTGITIITFFILITANHYKSELDCGNEPIAEWFVGWILILFLTLLIKLLRPLFIQFDELIYWLRVILIPFIFVGLLSWTFIGAVWLLRNYFSLKPCLPSLIYWGLFWGIFVAIISSLVSLIITIVLFFKQIPRLFKQKEVKQKLIDLYSDKVTEKLTYESFIDKTWMILEAEPILDIEKNLIKKYYTYHANGEDNEICSICYGNFNLEHKKIIISCKHSYHYDCIVNWFLIRPNCPCCKSHFRLALIQTHFNSHQKNLEIKD